MTVSEKTASHPQTLIYLNHFHKVSIEFCQRLAQEFSGSVLIHAPELQKHPKSDQVMQIFGDRLSLISIDVDEAFTPLQSLQQALKERAEQQVLWLESACDKELSVFKDQLEWGKVPADSVIVALPGLEGAHESQGLGRLMRLDGVDYRHYLGRSQLFPKQLFMELEKAHLYNGPRLLRAWITSGVRFLPLALDEHSRLSLPSWWAWRQWFWDIYFMTVSIFQGTTRPLRSSLAMGVGVFLACSPLYGLQTFLIAASCWLFRLNFPVAFLGAQISLPPTYTLVVAAELSLGARVTGRNLSLNGSWIELAEQHTLSWVVGFVLVGGSLAIIIGGLWYQILNWAGKKP